MRRSIRFVLAACTALLASSPSVRATLLVYEGFDYTAGANALNSKNGGTGYSAAYSSTNNADVVAGSFSYTDANSMPLLTAGNRAFLDSTTVGAPDGTAVSIAPIRNVTTSNFSSLSGPLYISFLGQQTAGDLRDVTVSLFAATNGTFGTQERLSIGHGNPSAAGAADGNNHWGAYANAVGQQGAYSSVLATALSLIVVRVDLNVSGTLDRFRVYVNPLLGTEPAAADADSSAYDFLTDFSEINRVRMRAGGSSSSTTGLNLGASQLQVDEIRIGTSYADVTPVPEPAAASAAIAGMLGASLLMARGHRH